MTFDFLAIVIFPPRTATDGIYKGVCYASPYDYVYKRRKIF